MNASPNPSPTSDSAHVIWICKEVTFNSTHPHPSRRRPFAPLQPIRQWLDRLNVRNPETAKRVCKLIPSQCPFERRVQLFGRTLLYIPPLCKLNPFYEEFVGLRFRALCYLADDCGEDVSPYC